MEKVPFLRGTPAQIFNFFQILRKIQAMGGGVKLTLQPTDLAISIQCQMTHPNLWVTNYTWTRQTFSVAKATLHSQISVHLSVHLSWTKTPQNQFFNITTTFNLHFATFKLFSLFSLMLIKMIFLKFGIFLLKQPINANNSLNITYYKYVWIQNSGKTTISCHLM